MVPVYILHNRELGYYSCYICNEFKMKTISFLLVGVALVAHWCSSQNIEDLGSPSNVSREDSARSRFLKSDDLQLIIMTESLYDEGGRLRSYSEMIGPSRDGGDAANVSFEVLEIESLYDEGGRLRSYSEMIGPSRDGGDAANDSFEVLEIESQEAIDSSPPIKPTNLTFEGVTPV